MLSRLILLFVLVPLTDLFLLMVLSAYIGWPTSVGIVIASGILGAFLARQSGLAVSRKIQQRMAQGQFSAELLTDGAMILFAAGLLLTPGFLTDLFGLSLLIPGCRRFYQRQLAKRFQESVQVHVWPGPGSSPNDPGVVDGEVVSGSGAPGSEDGTDSPRPTHLESQDET